MNILTLSDVSVSFGRLRAVDSVSFELLKGTATGLIGPNGAGKSTLFNAINGIIKCVKGRIIYNNTRIDNLNLYRIARIGIGRTFQTARPFIGMTVEENLMLGGFAKTLLFEDGERQEVLRRAHETAQLVGLLDHLSRKTDELPYGVLKRLGVGRALMTEPDLLLMDEPFAGIGGEEADGMLSCINYARQQGITLLIVEHKLNMLMQLVDDIVVMNAGEIIARGSPTEIAENDEVQKAYLGRKGGQLLARN